MQGIYIKFVALCLFLSCNSKSTIKKNIDPNLHIKNKTQHFYVSNIYAYKDLGEIFQQEKQTLKQITRAKQKISAMIWDSSTGNLIYVQSQKKPGFMDRILEPFVVNGPSGFSDYKIVCYNPKTQKKTILIQLKNKGITGSITGLGFLKNDSILAMNTHSGKIYLLDMHTQNTKPFEPQIEMLHKEMYHMQTDGKDHIFFRAAVQKNDKGVFLYKNFKVKYE